MPGILAVEGPSYTDERAAKREMDILNDHFKALDLSGLPLMVLCDDAGFTAANVNNFVWVTFTRSNPSHDIHGIDSFTEHKHWGCRGPLIIDARVKPHHAPELLDDPEIWRRVDALGAPGKSLHGII